ncbi:DUF4244 domain-containing protein [Arthrobacter sp. MYb211]|uniref:DUF4244 domain-containing protein n=1 Tax=Micrococcaceae TaxID=1268 RepID=UPI000CFACB08|nr:MULTISPECIES: DUF4244 domain-containing protein [unclassified Arthrobacter]PQZ99570.1 DUF4244 domain-containing protein [Arthrobacter sp. MYb224]PRA05964.1 DUF4244 domain-containing protein [Arthrobacter sp. MYb229]PRA11265.1 DUF4244 domain-containing protein [Arthrobacter sp. MYb221]PRB52866.1 DUF4244 domain-containing protein [Arthrobacter sp. MYb216]PRC07562.1 DUF4244 domain-containing protein [Arthrobacter sp. MYb211]
MKRMEAMISERLADEEGSTTAEFAMVTLAAVAFAGLLISILSSGDVRGMLMGLISKALSL